MIFRYLLHRKMQRHFKKLLQSTDYKKWVENGDFDRYWKMSEWQAFRRLFFPMSIIRETDPKHLLHAQRMIEKVLAEAKEKEERNKNSSA
jgi:hypothetical protein